MHRYSRTNRADLIAELITNALLALLGGWALMIAVGVIHHEWIKQCPTIGYGWSVLLASLIRSALYTHRGGGSDA